MKARLGEAGQKRFQREFGAVSAVRYPHCIQVLDLSVNCEVPYFTMELFRGAPITSLRGQPLSLILQSIDQAASAIDYVHAQGIIHRDVKPSNLLVRIEVDEHGKSSVETKLTDFGLARFTYAVSSLTERGGFVGTVLYGAPEQFANEMLDQRVDLYELLGKFRTVLWLS